VGSIVGAAAAYSLHQGALFPSVADLVNARR